MAILLHEYAARLAEPPKIQIFASDVDEDAIAEARADQQRATASRSVACAVGRLAHILFYSSNVHKRLHPPPPIGLYNLFYFAQAAPLGMSVCRQSKAYRYNGGQLVTSTLEEELGPKM